MLLDQTALYLRIQAPLHCQSCYLHLFRMWVNHV